jgi:trk system potassium uptake protein
MSNRRQVAVLGLGRFGAAVARELTRLGHDVLALEASEKIVNDVADEVTHAVRVDITDEDALRDLGLGSFDTAIVAVSSDLEVSILATVLLKRLGVRRIIAKAADELHGSILTQVGATRVVFPERETGVRVAHSFAAPGVHDYLDVAPGYGVARVPVPGPFVGQTLKDLNLHTTLRVTVVALRRGDTVTVNPSGSDGLRSGDELIVLGLDEDLERLPGATAEELASLSRS